MRELIAACVVVAAVGWAAAGPGSVVVTPRPGPGAGLTLPPHVHPGWPGWPIYPPHPGPRLPIYPPYPRPPFPPYHPGPRPPEVRLTYTVQYRPGPYASWRVYARYTSAAQAQAAAARLRAFGYQTDVVVTY
jgi:hypothetical protein